MSGRTRSRALTMEERSMYCVVRCGEEAYGCNLLCRPQAEYDVDNRSALRRVRSSKKTKQ